VAEADAQEAEADAKKTRKNRSCSLSQEPGARCHPSLGRGEAGVEAGGRAAGSPDDLTYDVS
jgi:hypothetical protein